MNWAAKLAIWGAIVLAGWALLVLVQYNKAISHDAKSIDSIALNEARIALGKDILYFRLSAFSGAFAPASPETADPKAMMRMAHALATDPDIPSPSLVGLHPASPADDAQDWEQHALKTLAGGKGQSHEFVQAGDGRSLRLMLPLFAEPKCLGCHAGEGVKPGGLLGGMSVTVPMQRYDSYLSSISEGTARRYASIFLAGTILVLTIFSGLLIHERLRKKVARKQAESLAQLTESEKKFRTLFMRVPVGMMLLDQNGVVKDCNPKCAGTFGATPEAITGARLLDRFSGELLTSFIVKLLHLGESHAEGQHATAGGKEPIHLRLHGVPLGQDLFLVMVEDITESTLAEEALLVSQAHMSMAMEMAGMGHWRFDVESGTFTFTDEFYALYATTADREGGHRMSAEQYAREFVHPDEAELVSQEVKRLLLADEPAYYRQIEHRIVRRDGETRYIVVRFHAIRDESGRITKTIGVNQDITERKQAEACLIRAKEDAEAASRAKSSFLANMSHEIRTPLNGILGMLQLMLTTALDSEQDQFVQSAIRSSNRLGRLLSDILDLSRIEAGKMDLKEDTFEPRNLREAVLDLFTMAAREKGLALSFDLDDSVPPALVGDEARIRQILFNLVGNAIKFTQEGEVAVSVTRMPAGYDGQVRLLFTVRDTGPGIPGDKMGSIFEPFVQGENSATRRYQGAGLGLSIVSRLTALLGGGMTVDSLAGKGTTMFISIPLKKAGSSPRTSPRTQQAAPPASLRILYAEDDAVTRMSLSRLLEKAGHTVLAAGDGRSALDILAAHAVDLVLMDVQMPEMDGVEATRAIRSGEPAPGASGVPIIALTANAMAGDRERFLKAGMDDYLAKPVNMAELNTVIGRVMAGSARPSS